MDGHRDSGAARRAANEPLDEASLHETSLGVIPCAAALVDRRLRVVSANLAFRKMTVTLDDVIGETIGRLLGCRWPPSECERCTNLCDACDIARKAIFNQEPLLCRHAQVECRVGDHVESLVAHVCTHPGSSRGEPVALMLFDAARRCSRGNLSCHRINGFRGMVGKHPLMAEMYNTITRVAPSRAPVLIQGESGTGKEKVAAAIHAESGRTGNLVIVNSGALPEGLLESELFGHVRGAFTGAVKDKRGRFELADRGTLFLDEIGEISPLMQVKLLRALQEGTFERVGGEQTIKVDVRVICATNRNLDDEVAAGHFRADLYYRISVVPISVPALRNHISDIPLLVAEFLDKAAAESQRGVPEVSQAFLDALMRYSWPGNIRELDSAIRFALLNADEGNLLPIHLPDRIRTPNGVSQVPGKLDVKRVNAALHAANGNKSRAAELLGVSRATLYRFFDHEQEPPGDDRSSEPSQARAPTPPGEEHTLARPVRVSRSHMTCLI